MLALSLTHTHIPSRTLTHTSVRTGLLALLSTNDLDIVNSHDVAIPALIVYILPSREHLSVTLPLCLLGPSI